MTIKDKHTTLPTLETLLDYLDGILDKESGSRIEAEISNSEELTSIISGLKYYYETNGYDRDKAEEYALNLGLAFEPSISSHGKKIYFIWAAAASVCILVISGILYLLSPFEERSVVAGYFEQPYPAPEVFRGEQVRSNEWIKITEHYTKGEFEEAIKLLQNIGPRNGNGITAKFYLGLCYLYLSEPQPEMSRTYLTEVVGTNHRLSERAKWYLALSFILEERNGDARKLLEEISSGSGFNSREARELLRRIN